MEKQKFLMEVLDIMQGAGGDEFNDAAFVLLKQAIRQQARNQNRFLNLPMAQWMINVCGVNVVLSEPIVVQLKDKLIEEGFVVRNYGNGYWEINW